MHLVARTRGRTRRAKVVEVHFPRLSALGDLSGARVWGLGFRVYGLGWGLRKWAWDLLSFPIPVVFLQVLRVFISRAFVPKA